MYWMIWFETLLHINRALSLTMWSERQDFNLYFMMEWAVGAELCAAICIVSLTSTIRAPEVRSYGNPAMVDGTVVCA
jgi:hypothetical protein